MKRKPSTIWLLRAFVLLILAAFCLNPAYGQGRWNGNLEIVSDSDLVRSGQTVTVSLVQSNRGKTSPIGKRQATFALVPERWNLFTDQPIEIDAKHQGDGIYKVLMPDVAAGWYRLYAAVADDLGALSPIGKIVNDDKAKRRSGSLLFAVTGPADAPLGRVYTERARCVFSPGEEVRLYLSTPTKGGKTNATVVLQPRGEDSDTSRTALSLINRSVDTGKTAGFDLPANLTRAIAPGDYDLVLNLGGREHDRWAVRFVKAEQPGGGTRVYHGGPWRANSSSAVNPWQKDWWIQSSAVRAYQANHWVNVFHGTGPIVGPNTVTKLPHANAPGLPASMSQQRPAHTHALRQSLMANGLSLSSMYGGSELGSENYMPVPMNPGSKMDHMALRYLSAALGNQQFPNYTGLYTDAYAKPDWHGGGELTSEEYQHARRTMWDNAWKHAGVPQSPLPPYKFEWDVRKLPKYLDNKIGKQQLTEKFGKRRHDPFRNYVKQLLDSQYGGKHKTLSRQPESVQLKHWNAMFAAVGMKPVEPGRNFVMPGLGTFENASINDTQRYRYTEYVQSGFGRGRGYENWPT